MKFEYAPAADLGDPLTKRLGNYPRVPDLTWDTLRFCGSGLAVTLLRLQYRLSVTGQIPQGDRIAIVANHQSHLDTITLLAAIPAKIRHQIVVLAAADYFFHKINRALAASLLCQAVALPIVFDMYSIVLTSWVQTFGLLGLVAGGKVQSVGPCGQTDRLAIIAFSCIAAAFGVPAWQYVIPGMCIGCGLTILLRIFRSIRDITNTQTA